MKSFLNFFLTIFLFSSVAVTADETQPTTTEPNSGDNLSRLYNSSARIDVNGAWDVFISGSYIFWQPKEDNLSYGIYYENSVPTAIKNLTFDYKSGFKVSLGTNFDHDNWTSYVDYTRLHTTESGKTSFAYGLIAANTYVRGIFGDYFQDYEVNYAKGKWTINYDMLNWVLARPLYNGTNITLAPFAGLKGGFIHQKYNATYINQGGQRTYYFISTNKSNSWLIGPRIGIDGSFLLGWDFRIIGNCSASLLYQHFNVKKYDYDIGYSNTASVNDNSKYNKLTPNIDAIIGLGWGSYFADNGWHFDLSATYDFNYYWNQNFMFVENQEVRNSINVTPGNLSFNGLTITAKLDF